MEFLLWNYFHSGKFLLVTSMIQHIPAKFSKRTLIHIPIIHTQADMGALIESFKKAVLQKLGKSGWEQKVNFANQLWEKIRQTIDDLTLSYEKVRIYQDGLPVCEKETEIITDLANAGSPNHQLLLQLLGKGATLMGTESAELLVEEYGLIKDILASEDAWKMTRVEAGQKELSDTLLKRRDQFIAHRINTTLQVGETGILFLGMLHSLAAWLDKDIQVVYPIHRPFRA